VRASLGAEVEEFLRVHGASTVTEIRMGVRARRIDVEEALTGEAFTRVPPPPGCSPRATYFNVSYRVPASPARQESRADRMLHVLRDGRARSRQEIFESAGGFFLTNNAASELRKRGYQISQRRERGVYVYQLVGASGEDEAA
jgi:hypothetical protein